VFDVEVTIAHSEGAPYRRSATDEADARHVVEQLLAAWGLRMPNRLDPETLTLEQSLAKFGSYEADTYRCRIRIKRAAA
jgi:hypothetical protein